MSVLRPKLPNAEETRRPKRVFTLAEADRALVLVKRVVSDVMTEYARVLDLQESLEAAETSAPEQYRQLRLELIRSAGKLRTFVEELEDVGVELKDWSLGVVDFPCLAGGRNVCLCWRHGDEGIRYWHEVDAGLAGLQPITTLPSDGAYARRKGSSNAQARSARGAPRPARTHLADR